MTWSVSDAYKRAIKRSHRMAVRVSLYDSGVFVQDLKFDSGQLTMNDDSDIQRTCNLTVIDESGALAPQLVSDPLAPSGNELYISRGVYLPDGTAELIPQGVFGISGTQTTDSGGGLKIQVTGQDRSARVARGKLTAPFASAMLDNRINVIKQLLTLGYPGIQFYSWPVDYAGGTLPSQYYEVGTDPWKEATKLATDMGYDLFFDGLGRARLEPIDVNIYRDSRNQVTTSGEIGLDVQFLDKGQGSILAIQKNMTRQNQYNHIIVIGEPQGMAPVRGEVYDNDPQSPTFIGGKFGDVPYIYKSNNIFSEDQAFVVAQRLFAKMVGKQESLHISMIPNPSLELRDAIWIRRAISNIDDAYVIDGISMPLIATRAADITARQVA